MQCVVFTVRYFRKQAESLTSLSLLWDTAMAAVIGRDGSACLTKLATDLKLIF